jgi:hypothetical protein
LPGRRCNAQLRRPRAFSVEAVLIDFDGGRSVVESLSLGIKPPVAEARR